MKGRALALVLALPPSVAACPGTDAEAGAVSLVVGVQSDELGALVGSVHVVVKKDDIVVRDEAYATVAGAPTPLPKEIELSGAVGSRIDVTAEALPVTGGGPIVSRLASARLPAALDGTSRKLLRVYLESRCVVLPSPGGSPVGVTCTAPLTCVSGVCAASEVSDALLEDYEPKWALAPPDICRPPKHGPPEVILGTGQTDYAGLSDGQVLQLEKGPQGGHHLWVAARMKNLRQSGSTTSISAMIEGDPIPAPPVSFVFTFDRDEGSYCKVWGLRYQVDAGTADLRNAYKRFLGRRLSVTVAVLDSTGAKASSTKTVQVADKLLCPDGTDSCNQL